MEPSRENPKPLYQQVADAIRREIESGKLPPNASIGSQFDLMQRYRVSRVTVRQAIKVLEREGLVVTKQGKGSFVAATGLSQELGDLLSLGEIAEAHGVSHKVHIADFRWVIAPEPVRTFFGIEGETPVLRIKRRHVVSGVPIALAVIYVPVEIGLALTREEVQVRPLYTIMEMKMNLRLGRAYQQIQAMAADSQLATFLEISAGSPVLVAERRTFSEQGKPVEHITFYYRSEFYRFTVSLQRAKTFSMVVPPFPTEVQYEEGHGGRDAYVAASLQLIRDPRRLSDIDAGEAKHEEA